MVEPGLRETEGVSSFLAGTRIATPSGEIRVECLTQGAWIITAEGATVEVLDCREHSVPRNALTAEDLPVCITAGALGQGLPMQDLYVAAGQDICRGRQKITAGDLVNGETVHFVAQNQLPEQVAFYHIEIAARQEILANGTPTASCRVSAR